MKTIYWVGLTGPLLMQSPLSLDYRNMDAVFLHCWAPSLKKGQHEGERTCRGLACCGDIFRHSSLNLLKNNNGNMQTLMWGWLKWKTGAQRCRRGRDDCGPVLSYQCSSLLTVFTGRLWAGATFYQSRNTNYTVRKSKGKEKPHLPPRRSQQTLFCLLWGWPP